MTPVDAFLAFGATLRLTRLVTTDDLGRPMRGAMHRAIDDRLRYPILGMTREEWHGGVACPYCVGFHIGVLVLASHEVAPPRLWRFAAATLALNYAVGHVAARLD